MTAVWVVLALVPWIIIGAVGAPLVATGRRFPPGLPSGYPEGWPLRVFGLVYVAMALFMTYQTVAYGVRRWDSVIFMYVGAAFFVGYAIYKFRKQRKGAARLPRPGNSS